MKNKLKELLKIYPSQKYINKHKISKEYLNDPTICFNESIRALASNIGHPFMTRVSHVSSYLGEFGCNNINPIEIVTYYNS